MTPLPPREVLPPVPGMHTPLVSGAPVDVDELSSSKLPMEVVPARDRPLVVVRVLDLVPRLITQPVNETERSRRKLLDVRLAKVTAKDTHEVQFAFNTAFNRIWP